MYSYVKAICLSKTIGSQWKDIDLSNYLVSNIFNSFSKVYLEVSNTVLTDNKFIDLDQLRDEFWNSNLKINDIFQVIGNKTLLYVDKLPNTNVSYVKYFDAFMSEYSVDVCKIGVQLPEGFPKDNLVDLKISRPKYKTDINKLYTHCLTTVNGYIHWTETDGKYLYVKDGGNSLRKCNHNQIGFLSFMDIGAIKKIAIKESNINSGSLTDPLKHRIFLSVEEDITNKAVFLVLGGYLVFPQTDVFWQSGENIFSLDINRLPYIERFYESSLYLNIQKDLALATPFINKDMIGVENLKSDEIIKKYLTLSQSFFVVVDKQRLSLNRIYLKHTNLPGQFISYQDPSYPLIMNHGKIAEYWKTARDGSWDITVQDAFMRNYILSEQPETQLINVNNFLIPNHSYKTSRSFLLEIAGYNL